MKDEDWIESIGSAACADCRFYDTHWADEAIEVGACQRFSPRSFDQTEKLAQWTMVRSSDWCGEFQLDPSARRAFEAERLARWNGQIK